MHLHDTACLMYRYRPVVTVNIVKYITGSRIAPNISFDFQQSAVDYGLRTLHPVCRLKASVACLGTLISIIPKFSNLWIPCNQVDASPSISCECNSIWCKTFYDTTAEFVKHWCNLPHVFIKVVWEGGTGHPKLRQLKHRNLQLVWRWVEFSFL